MSLASQPYRRNGSSEPAPNKSSSKPKAQQQQQSQRVLKSPYLPTILELSLLALYPATLLLGSLFSLLNPPARAAPYSASSQSHPSALAPSYFAQKHNIFNLFFVKIGWFWTTFAFLVFVASHPYLGPPGALVLTPRRLRALVRWMVVTAWWIAVTQWFFGAPLIDKGFRITGGVCEILRAEEGRVGGSGKLMGSSEAKEVFTNAACKLAGGRWKGGTDISGHVFLLVLGSAFLWMEVLPVVLKVKGLREERMICTDVGSRSAATETMDGGVIGLDEDADEGTVERVGINIPLVVAGLSWWMLLMTAAYFHTWFEKFTGLLVAFGALYSVYFLPRAVPSLRAVVGMPGV
ncbi:MAG: hypothetical protein M1812_004517 [Candelaria pacifica]|nr:MAG: hypothetical protein M1812_004517 [Candelaria pacifica]